MPGEEGGNPSEEGFPPPDPHLPKTFDWWGGGAQGVRSGLVLKNSFAPCKRGISP